MMKKYWKYLLISFFTWGCASTQSAEVTAPAEPEVQAVEADNGSLMIPKDALKSPKGLAYVYLEQGNGEKPDIDAVKVHLRVLNIEGKLMGDESLSIAMSHSTPFLEDMLPLLEIGAKVRVWGESQDRIWEIELLGVDEQFRAPADAMTPPEDSLLLKDYDNVHWKVVEPGQGENAKRNQAFEIYASRWQTTGEILESNRSGKGMIVYLNEENAQIDPIHLAVLQEVNEGSHIRIWIPTELNGLNSDIVEDMWVGRHVTELDAPVELTVPASNVQEIEADGAWMRVEKASGSAKLVENDNVEVNMTCWNASNGNLIDAGMLHGHHEVMEIKPELGVWFKIMQQASPGDVVMAWIKSSAMPEQVTMDLTCRVEVFDKVE